MRPRTRQWFLCLGLVGLYAFNLCKRSRVFVVVPNTWEIGDFATEDEGGEGLIADAFA